MHELVFYYNYPETPTAFQILQELIHQHQLHSVTPILDEFLIDAYVLIDKPDSRNIAIDFDNTITEDPDFYKELITLYRHDGWNPVICTLREDTPDDREEMARKLPDNDISLYFTNGESKQAFMQQKGLDVCLWIDDYFPSISECDSQFFMRNGIAL
jgi:hypothetical protein